MKKLLLLVLFASMVFVLGAFLIISPQSYSLKNKLAYKNFEIYSDQALPKNTTLILDNIDHLIEKSELYSSLTVYKVYIRSDYSVCNLLPYQFSKTAFASTTPYLHTIYISKGDFATNLAYKASGESRPLDKTVAGEIMHILLAKDAKIKHAAFPEDLSQAGMLWKVEGYADYIGGGTTIDKQKGINILNEVDKSQYNKHDLERFKCWLAVTYLIDKRKMKINDILHRPLSLDPIVQEATGYWVNPQKEESASEED